MKMYRVFGVALGMLTGLLGGSAGKVYGQAALQEFKTLRSFVTEVESTSPSTGVIEGSDGVLYGASGRGGSGSNGTVYKINKDGSGYQVLRNFSWNSEDGTSPGYVMEGSDGFLYGLTSGGGINNAGVLFKMKKDGSGYAVLHQFTSIAGDGVKPMGTLVQGIGGALYGVTWQGGISNLGTIFMIHPDGTGYTILHHFAGVADGDGYWLKSGLILATNNCLYGTTTDGGEHNGGTMFKVNQDGSGYSVIKSFSPTEAGGFSPGAALIQGNDGMLYGMTQARGASVFKLGLDGNNYTIVKQIDDTPDASIFIAGSTITRGAAGQLYLTVARTLDTIFSLNTDGSNFTALKVFTGNDGTNVATILLLGRDGALYGTASYGGIDGEGTVYRLNTDGSGFTVLKTFRSTGDAAVEPKAPVLLAGDGALYGTTEWGGTNGFGTIFKMSRDGSNFLILKHFGGLEGQSPLAGLVEGAGGALYGTTARGGSNNCGVIFRLNKDGSDYSVVRTFGPAPDAAQSNPSDPLVPFAAPGLTVDSNQVLYGVTPQGGINNVGAIFRIDPSGTGYTVLKSFNGGADGANPEAGLLLGVDGALYGTTWKGGENGQGVVFKMQRDGTGFTVLKSFPPGPNSSALSLGALVQDDNGVMYGTLYNSTNRFGAGYQGAVFKLNADGSGYAVLKNFTNSVSDGANPWGLVRGIDGTLYGTASQGGAGNLGTVFRLRPDGSNFAVLKSFSDTSNPMAVLTASSDGRLYGTTTVWYGGTVFSLTPGVLMSVPIRSGNNMQMQLMTGIPGRTYKVERATSLAGPWSTLTQVMIGMSGVADCQDSNPPEGGAFYRAVYP